MFQGSIPASLRAVVHEAARGWGASTVHVGCSGNFTVERTLWDIGVKCHGNDVSIYTCALGALLSGTEQPLSVEAEYEEDWGWLTPYLLRGQRERCAVLMLSTTMMAGLLQSNLYYDRQRQAYRDQWERMFDATVEKLEAMPVELLSFYAGDVMPWLETVPEDGAVISFPPFWANGYESLFKPLDTVFDWPGRPEYDILDEERIAEFFDAVMSRKHWMVALNHEREDLAEYLKGRMKTSNRGVPIFVYTNQANARLIAPEQTVTHCKLPIIDGEVGEKASIVLLTAGDFNELRSLYLDPAIPPAAVLQAYGLMVDGVLVGVWAISRPDGLLGNFAPAIHPHVYLISDFPVGDGTTKKLSALVLRAALSRESQLLAERSLHRRVRGIVTTAFSKKPVSMKYRGLFKLLSRKEDGPKFILNYGATIGEWTLQEGLDAWLKSQKSSQPA